jgi:alcohol-forming fatty acyl-CoA reductase
MFKRIMDEKPEMMSKIYPVWGEITKPNLGMNEQHLQRVIITTQIVFHLAASLKLEATLKPNIETNLTATKYVLDVAKQMKNLIQMVHTSTAFCNIEDDIVYEKVYDHPHDPEEIIRTSKWMSEEAMAEAQKKILANHPNTYTYTKLLAEILVKKYYERDNLPLCIFRPSIVVPAHKEPLPGWVDSLNGPPGVIMAVGGGALRCMLLDINQNMQSIPVDICINALITSTKFVASLNTR